MTFEHSVEVRAGAAAVFALTQDYGRRLAWDPFLRSAALVPPATAAGVGARAYCEARSGLGMETVYVSFRPPAVAAVRMTRGPWFLSRFAGSWRFREVGPGRTRVTFRYQLRARPGWLAWLVTPALAWAFRRDTRRRLAALQAAFDGAGPHGP